MQSPPGQSTATTPTDEELLVQLRAAADRVRQQVARVIVGQSDVIEQLLIALISQGHVLLVGVPGLAKTMLIRTLAGTLSLDFSRIQFTPDLMPADITGTEVMQEDRSTGQRAFRFLPGPLFANVVLADEVNRTPPKTQAALLEAMQEGQVTAGGQRHLLPQPFFVLATQNPIEQEGTYPLPEAQLDRFMFQVWIDYPLPAEELEIVLRTTSQPTSSIDAVLSTAELQSLFAVVRRMPIAEHVARYAVELSRRSRPQVADAFPFVRENVQWGAGPRASQFLTLGAKARAALAGRLFATTDDVAAVALPVLRHRIKTNFNADAEGISAETIVRRLVAETPVTHEEPGRGSVANVLRSASARPS